LAVADLTVTSARSTVVDFTTPFLQTSIGILHKVRVRLTGCREFLAQLNLIVNISFAAEHLQFKCPQGRLEWNRNFGVTLQPLGLDQHCARILLDVHLPETCWMAESVSEGRHYSTGHRTLPVAWPRSVLDKQHVGPVKHTGASWKRHSANFIFVPHDCCNLVDVRPHHHNHLRKPAFALV
jgi:hypothetical protein